MPPVLDLESQIRDFINAPRRQAALFNDKAAWGMLCSSLDVIGDTEVAIEAYLKGVEEQADDRPETEHLAQAGNLYITLYGILQALFVQQDAVHHLAEALGLDYAHDPVLNDVRETRNDAIGHPTKRGRGVAFNFISRNSLSLAGCTLLTLRADGRSEFREIDVPAMIRVQRGAVETALRGMLGKLKEDEMEHRKKFRQHKLADAFPKMLNYCHEKIAQTIGGDRFDSLGKGFIEQLDGCIEKFKDGLRERGSFEAYDAVTAELALLECPIAELFNFFSQPEGAKLNEKDAVIFHSFIRRKIEKLIEMAKEIDQTYEEDV